MSIHLTTHLAFYCAKRAHLCYQGKSMGVGWTVTDNINKQRMRSWRSLYSSLATLHNKCTQTVQHTTSKLPPTRQAQPAVICICSVAKDMSLDRSWSMVAASAAVYASGGAKQAYGRQAVPQSHWSMQPSPRGGGCRLCCDQRRKKEEEGRERKGEREIEAVALWRDAEGCNKSEERCHPLCRWSFEQRGCLSLAHF